MTPNIIIEQVLVLPSDLDQEVVPASVREGFEPITWLRDHWVSGENRFAEEGEAFYVARSEGRLVGVCGVNRDPHTTSDSVGRLRRLYVLPGIRRMGVGTLLVERAISDARSHFTVVRLRTLDEQSASFFEAIGFTQVENQEEATHEMPLKASPPRC
jgi:N-acetylglutamate synthase-like GNAT family acetyltransferase